MKTKKVQQTVLALHADIWVQTEDNYKYSRGFENMTGLLITKTPTVPQCALYTLVICKHFMFTQVRKKTKIKIQRKPTKHIKSTLTELSLCVDVI